MWTAVRFTSQIQPNAPLPAEDHSSSPILTNTRDERRTTVRRLTVLLLVCLPLFANAANVTVNCNLPAPLGKINIALKYMNPAGPNTITVIGTCKENVYIQGFDRLTLIAKPGAVITDASGGQQWAVVYISDSRRISIQGFTISGGNVGVRCENFSFCRFSGNTFTGTAQRGVDINDSDATFSGDIFQNNSGQGIFAQSSHFTAAYLTLQNNQSGTFIMWSTVIGNNWTVSNNAQDGIFVAATNFQLIDSNVYGNAWNGIDAVDLSDLSLPNDTVTGNGYDGVYIGDTTKVAFNGGRYTGNGLVWGAPDIGCGEHYALADGIAGIYGNTNCPVPQVAAAQVKAK